MVGFRKKILLIDFLLVVLIVACLFPLAALTVNRIMRGSLTNRGKAFIVHLQSTSDTQAMIETIQTNGAFAFQPLSLLDSEGQVIYPDAEESTAPEVKEAMQSGFGFSERPISSFDGNFYCVALPFTAHDQKYILDIYFRGSEIDQLKFDFEIAIVILSVLLLVILSTFHTFTVQWIMRPIQQIIDCIRPYKEGKEELLPRVVLKKEMQGGEFSKLAYTLNSLTDRIQTQIDHLTRQRKETEDILESINEGIIATDTSAKVTFVNQVACRMLGISSNALFGQTLNSIKASTGELPKKCHELILHALQTSEPIVQTWTLREKGPFYFNLISAPLTHQNGSLLVLQDKTSDYKVIEMGKDFIANASHELRTPITIIRGFAETLQDLPELSQEMLKEITEKIVRTCGRLDKLVRSLLTLADIENLSKDRLKLTDLIALAENCKHLLLTAHPNVHLSIKCQLDTAPIVADTDLFELAILNLLENAIKYSQAPAYIELKIYQEGQELFLSVHDQGIGISDADLPHIFDRFYTVDKARSRKSGGAGLGLSIVKTIVDKHNGRIIATSKLNAGSTFTIALPLKRGQ